MKTSPIFQPDNPSVVHEFVSMYPLAQVVSCVDLNLEATPLPLVAEADSDGGIKRFIGHFARANPQVEMLKTDPRALLIFQGPHGYISPSWMRDRTQAPTWNFQTAHFLVDINLADHQEQSAEVIELLLDQVEADGGQAWRSSELGERYSRLLRGVVGFTAEVVETRVKFKLGQNERQDVYEDIVVGLQESGNVDLALTMEATNNRCPHLLNRKNPNEDNQKVGEQ